MNKVDCKVVLLVIGCCLGVAINGKAQTPTDSVFYFIDSDSRETKEWTGIYLHTPIAKGLINQADSLIANYKNIVRQRVPDKSVETTNAVFRYQPTSKEIDKTYLHKEKKMKGRGYMVILIK